ncbi:putative yir4 protein [Plasmodium yoelii yoelii]|uniref:Yir4 protein n=3 Tax=Plasmodium yoelii TaxID=5861 RepID=Q7RKD0_PLAYO|nr:putative yir4 protein [Plasmodium yoelii yoelii]WBY58975.1 PIR protein [Plasmodium yoelii yoelii]
MRKYLPDKLSEDSTLDFYQIENINKYCPDENCNTELDKITAGFLWLLGQYFTISTNRSYNESSTNAFFIYIISWFSYKLNQNSEHNSTQISDFYTKRIKNSDKYSSFTNDAYKFTDIKEVLNKKSDLLNINIKDMSEFYDAFKLLCNIYGNVTTRKDNNTLSNSATSFVNKYTELNNDSKIEGTARSKILSALSTDYNKLKSKYNGFPSIPETSANSFALTSEDTSSSSIGKRLFTILSIFGAIAFFLGIFYKYSLFGFRKRFQKQKLREKIKNIKKKMNH